MKTVVTFLCCLILSSCAHGPKCGNLEGAKVILAGEKTCQVRIRQVTVGTELKIPASLKGPGLADFSLEWVESDLRAGQIELGHFVLIPTSERNQVKP